MAKRKLESRLVKRCDINEEMRLIDESNVDYITPSGKVYSDYGNDLFYPKTPFVNKRNGYVYVGITDKSGKPTQRRLHRLLAIAFIPNPEGLEYVMHIDNDKANYDLENLKWGTPSENTRQAYDDMLITNDSGSEDSQSVGVDMYSLYTTELVRHFGSISLASKELGLQKTTIICSCEQRYKEIRKPYYFRYTSDGNIDIPSCIGMYDMNTDKLIGMYINCAHASKETGIKSSTITTQVLNDRKPKNSKHAVYFLRINR